MPLITSLIWCAIKNRTLYGVAPEPYVESKNQAEGHISLESSLLFEYIQKISSRCHVSRSARALNPNLSDLEKRIQRSWYAMKKYSLGNNWCDDTDDAS
jgi:hypothetical protein